MRLGFSQEEEYTQWVAHSDKVARCRASESGKRHTASRLAAEENFMTEACQVYPTQSATLCSRLTATLGWGIRACGRRSRRGLPCGLGWGLHFKAGLGSTLPSKYQGNEVAS